MRFLVAGGGGFIGSHLCTELVNRGHYVICFDNFETGKFENLASLIPKDNFKVITGDVTIPTYFDVDGIFNLACPASPTFYQQDPIQTSKTNFLGSLNLLNLARENNIRILQASTSEVYGDPTVSPQGENYWGNVNPIGIRACYDEGKRIAETLFFDYHRMYGTDIRVARIFNTYGPNMAINDGRVISNFIVQSVRKQTLTVYGDGSQVRSFCYIDDLVDGLLKLFFSKDIYEPVNLGNPEAISIGTLATKIQEISAKELNIPYLPQNYKVDYHPLPSDDPKIRIPDITKALNLLKWTPKIPLDNGITLTLNYFMKIMNEKND